MEDVKVGQIRICKEGYGLYKIVGKTTTFWTVKWYNSVPEYVSEVLPRVAIEGDILIHKDIIPLYKVIYGD